MQRVGAARRAKEESEPARQMSEPFGAWSLAGQRARKRLTRAEQRAGHEGFADIGAPNELAQIVLHAHRDGDGKQREKPRRDLRKPDRRAKQREFARKENRQT